MEVTGSLGKGAEAKKYTTNYNFGANTAESAKMFGDPVVHKMFLAKVVIDLQNLIRNGIKTGKKPEEIEASIKAWKPGITVSRKKSSYEKTLADVSSFTDEQLATVAKRAAELLAEKRKK